MCCRYALHRRDLARAAEKLRARLAREADDHFNIPPGRAIPALRTGTTGREVAWLHWGLVPHWAKNRADFDTRLANARAESLAEKPSFRDALQKRRCAIPATGFYEWETRHDSGQPWYFHAPQDEPLYFAGLWETWTDPDGALLESCTLVTTAPNALMRPIHDRMPALLSVDTCEAWLAAHTLPPDTVARILQPAPDGALVAHRVGVRVNRLAHDDVACLAEVAPPAEQLGLGL
ncbi:MAG TPA: SOS response-associated peptidase [Opitutaceae bacterium]|nr:SOS response-associated peptidase [Opitutaceae bacterium]